MEALPGLVQDGWLPQARETDSTKAPHWRPSTSTMRNTHKPKCIARSSEGGLEEVVDEGLQAGGRGEGGQWGLGELRLDGRVAARGHRQHEGHV